MAGQKKRYTLRVGEIARRFGVSPDTLRHYERVGVLPPPPRSPAGYCEYPPTAIERIQVIRNALTAGFTLSELARAFEARRRGEAPCRTIRQVAKEKLSDVEEQITALLAQRELLHGLLIEWDRRLAATPNGAPADLFAALPSSGGENEDLSTHAPGPGIVPRRQTQRRPRAGLRRSVDRLHARGPHQHDRGRD